MTLLLQPVAALPKQFICNESLGISGHAVIIRQPDTPQLTVDIARRDVGFMLAQSYKPFPLVVRDISSRNHRKSSFHEASQGNHTTGQVERQVTL